MGKRSSTTKDVGLLFQLFKQSQLDLAAESQRNAVWPRPAKAYLIDTIMSDQPMPLFFFLRGQLAQSGRTMFSVVDGQQRIRAILEFLEIRFTLKESTDPKWRHTI